jgi:hypothetical protein
MSRSLERQRPVQPRGKKTQVLLQAILFTPLTLITVAGVTLALAKIVSGDLGYVVLLFVSSLLAFILGYHALHYIRDLSAQPIHSEGEISKKWTKGNLFFFFLPSYYVAVKGNIYSLSRHQYRGLLEEDLVRIRHYPHTLTVEFVERFDEAEKKFVPAEPDGSL